MKPTEENTPKVGNQREYTQEEQKEASLIAINGDKEQQDINSNIPVSINDESRGQSNADNTPLPVIDKKDASTSMDEGQPVGQGGSLDDLIPTSNFNPDNEDAGSDISIPLQKADPKAGDRGSDATIPLSETQNSAANEPLDTKGGGKEGHVKEKKEEEPVDKNAAEPDLMEIQEIAAELDQSSEDNKSRGTAMDQQISTSERGTEEERLKKDAEELTASIDFQKDKETDSEDTTASQSTGSESLEAEEKVLTPEEKEEEQEQAQLEKNEQEGIRDGKRVGRSVGYGRFIKIKNPKTPEEQKAIGAAAKARVLDEGGTEEAAVEAEKKAVEEATVPDYEVGEFPDNMTKEEWRDKEMNAAKAMGESKQCYYDGFSTGYNQGYNEGQAFKNAEAKANAQKEYNEKLQSPDYKMGKELGVIIGASTIQNKEDLEYTTPDGKKTYNTKVAVAKQNAMMGKAPDGSPVSDPEGKLLKEAFTYHFNQAYRVASAKKSSGPTHAEKLADEDFRGGYEAGNALGRGNDADGKLQEQKMTYFTPAAAQREEKEEAYKKEKAGFIYGFNVAGQQLKAEKEAAEKAEKKKKLANPSFKLGYAAGTMNGILMAVFPGEEVHSKTNEELQEAGLGFAMPENVRTAIATKKNTNKLDTPEKQEEADAYFGEAFSVGERQGYNKGVQQKAYYKANAYRLNPDYAKFFDVVISTPIQELEREEQMNMGQLVAYATYKINELPAGDENRAKFEELVNKVKGKIASNPSEHYQAAYRDSYNDLAKQIQTGKGKFGAKFVKAAAIQKYAGKNPEEKYAFKLGNQIAKIQIEEEKKIKKLRGKSREERQAINQQIKDKFHVSLEKAKNKLIDEYISDEASSEDLIKRLHDFLINGYNDAIYQEQKGVDKKGMGNDEKEVADAVAEKLKNDKHSYDQKVLDQLGQHYKEGAADGYNHAFNFYKAIDVESGQTIPGSYTETTKFEEGKENRKKQLLKLMKEDGTPWFEEGEGGLKTALKYYTEGYNLGADSGSTDKGLSVSLDAPPVQSGDQSYGAKKGAKDGRAYMKGYQYGVLKSKASGATTILKSDYEPEDSNDLEAFNKGITDSEYKASYDGFASGMVRGNKEIGELMREAEGTEKVGQPTALMQQVKKDTKVWSIIAAYVRGAEVEEEEAITMSLYDGMANAEKEVNANTSEELLANKDMYTDQVIAWKRNSMRGPMERQILREQNKQDAEGLTLDERRAIDAILTKRLDVYVDTYGKAYREMREGMLQKAEGVSLDNWYEAVGYRDGFRRIMGNTDQLPAELNNIVVEDESTLDKTHPFYIKGNEEGALLAMEMKTGLITEEELHTRLDEKDYIDTGYTHAREQGAQSGKYDAIQENHYELIPEPYKNITFIEGDIPQEVKDVYYESYWKARDSKAGELEGLKAAVSASQEDDYNAKALYTPIDEEDNETKGKKGKRIVKYTDIFENAFINAREAANASEDPQALLDGIAEGKEVDEDGELSDEANIKDIANREEAVIAKAKEYGVLDAKDATDSTEPSQDYRAAMDIKASMVHSTETSEDLESTYIVQYWIARNKKTAELVALQAAKDKVTLDAESKEESKYHAPLSKKGNNEPPKNASTEETLVEDTENASVDAKLGSQKTASEVSSIEKRYYHDGTGLGKNAEEIKKAFFDNLDIVKEKLDAKGNVGINELLEKAESSDNADLDIFEQVEQERAEEEAKLGEDIKAKVEQDANQLARKAGYYSGIQQLGLNEKLKDLENNKGNVTNKEQLALLKILSLDGLGIQNKQGRGGDATVPLSEERSLDKIENAGDIAEKIKALALEETANRINKLKGPDNKEAKGSRGSEVWNQIVTDNIELYKKTFNEFFSSYEMQAIADLTNIFTFNDVGNVGGEGNAVGEGSSDESSEESAEDAAQDLADILKSQNDGQIRDVQFNTLPILKVFKEQEYLIESTQNEVASIRTRVWGLDDDIADIEGQLITSENRLLIIDQEIADLEAQKPLKVAQKKELNKLRAEKNKAVKADKKKQTNIDKLTKELDREKGYINDSTLNIDNFLKNRLKFRTTAGPDTRDAVLDYLDVFIERLQVTGQFGYNETGVKLNGGGVLIVEKNAEDVYTGTDVTVNKGDFKFKASGLEYNEDKNRLILSGGSALIPKLEGAKNSRDKTNYDFDGLSFDLNQGVFLQLKLQKGKLRAGAVPMSTGTRSAAPQQEKLNPSAPQNTPTKTDTTT